MNEDKIKIDTGKVVDKVYHIKELHAILEDITVDFINQVVLMKDGELKEDRSEWIKRYGRDEDRETAYAYETSVHTLAIEIEQLRRWNKIIYKPKMNMTEKSA